MNRRITKHELFMNIAITLALRSRCKRKKVGCLIIKDKTIISSGCNGPLKNSTELGFDEHGYCTCPSNEKCGELESVHAEQNVIAFSARRGIALENSTMYVTLSPCMGCAKIIIPAGISHVIYLKEYRITSGIEFLERNGIKVDRYSSLVQEY